MMKHFRPNINDPKHPVVLFIPEAGIYPYMRGLAILGDVVTKYGGKVLVTHDTGQMLRSPIMAMYKTSVNVSVQERDKIRRVTEKDIKDVLEKYHFSSIELSDLVDSKLIKEINSLTDEAGKDLKKIRYRGFAAGEMAEFDFILETKFPYYQGLSGFHKKLYLQYIKNTALAIAITDHICERYKPSLFLTFNEYAQCQAVNYSAETHHIPYMSLTYASHLNFDTSKFVIWKSSWRRWIDSHIARWNEFKDIPIEDKSVSESWNDSVFRMYSSGSHIFSQRKQTDPDLIFNNLKLNPNRKTIIVYTSSQEERRCAEIAMKVWKENNPAVDVFSSQIEWLSVLRGYAAKRDDIQIVVRVHPREGFRQFGFNSLHLLQLKAKFKKNSSNFVIVWPDDPISSYDLMELADICLISWSNIGQEAARVGIPVLSCVGNMHYPDDDFVQVATSRKEYIRKLDAMLKMDYKWKYLVKAIRFYHWRTFIPSLDLGKTVPKYFDDDGVWPKAPPSMMGVLNDVLSGKQDLIEYNIKMWGKSLPKNAVFQETKAMKQGIRYFLDNVFYPPSPQRQPNIIFLVLRRLWREITGKNLPIFHRQRIFEDYHLKYADNITKLRSWVDRTKTDSKLRVILTEGREAVFIHKGRIQRRMSPMVLRLAKLHDSR
jgi:hypothetical protein